MEKVFIVLIAIVGILFGKVKLDAILAKRKAEKAESDAMRATTERDMARTSVSLFSSLAKELDKVNEIKAREADKAESKASEKKPINEPVKVFQEPQESKIKDDASKRLAMELERATTDARERKGSLKNDLDKTVFEAVGLTTPKKEEELPEEIQMLSAEQMKRLRRARGL